MQAPPSLRRAAMAGLAAALSLLLAACFVTPGKFDAALDLRKDGRFTYSYKGEIFVLGLSELARMADEAEQANDKFTPLPCYADDAMEKERTCTSDDLDEQKANWETERQEAAARRKKESDQLRTMLGGLDPSDPKAAEELANRLRRQHGFTSVTYKGNGLYVVDFRISGMLSHDFAFPTIEKMPNVVPFFVINRRADGSARLDSPAFLSQEGMGNLPFGNIAQMAAAEKAKASPEEAARIPDFPQVDGRFVLTTDGEILANNTDEGPKADPAGKRLEWTITPRDKVGPMALIGLGK
ncbi:MAG: hypothetical protein GXC70_03835 [Sphingomonadaceae bacterium]|nr:hypothetical protein [Sphingomonadaceae bacterium]